MRVFEPTVIVLTAVVVGTGLELWLVAYRFGFVWVPVHRAAADLCFAAISVLVWAYLGRASNLVLADWRDHLRSVFTRRALVAGCLVLGAVLAIAMLAFPTPFLPAPGDG